MKEGKCKICNIRKATQKAPYEGMCCKCSLAKEIIASQLNLILGKEHKVTDRYKANILNSIAEDYEYWADREQ